MVIGESRVTNMFFNMLDNDAKNNIDNYVNCVCSRDFMIFNSMEQVYSIFGDSVDKFLSSLSSDELLNLRSYTGYNYKNINAILRGNWNYEVNGYLEQSKSIEFRMLASSVNATLDKFEIPNIDFTVFRGTTIDSFSSYGVSNITDLKNLEGKFLYEQGFTSTSILKESSYANKKLDDGRFCNVEIRYLIPSESNDGALLTNSNVSYATNQNEFLLNSGSLIKIIDVKVDENTNSAVLTAILIPKKIYDLEHNRSQKSSKNV